MVAQRGGISGIGGIDDVVPLRVKQHAPGRPAIEKVQVAGMVLATTTGLTAVAAAVVTLLQG